LNDPKSIIWFIYLCTPTSNCHINPLINIYASTGF